MLPHLIPPGTSGNLLSFGFEFTSLLPVLFQPLQGDIIERGTANRGRGPRNRVLDKRPEPHVDDVGREVGQAIEDVSGI